MPNALLTEAQQDKVDGIVNDLFEKYRPSFDQRPVLKQIIKDQNIILKESDLKDISGMLFKDAAQWVILLNQTDSDTRKLFTLAHELGHYYLHSDSMDKFVDSQFISNTYHRNEDTKYFDVEVEANEFAGAFIMPKIVIDEYLNRKSDATQENILDLSKKFHVSPLAVETRLKNLGYART